MNTRTILIADDHSIIRKGLKLYLQHNLGYKNVSEVQSCSSLMSALNKDNYTHLILDIILSDGISLEILPNIKSLYPHLNILVFSMQPKAIYAKALAQYGIHYYITKTASEDYIISEMNRFLLNESESLIIEQLNGLLVNPFSTLSARELEVLHYLLKGLGTKEIAETLNIKMNSVSTIKSRIMEKTSCKNIKELTDSATLHKINF